MNNNQMNFDPITGQPINNVAPNQQPNPVPTIENVQPVQPAPVSVEPQVAPVQPQPTVQPIEQQTTNNAAINPQQQMQGIATVEQTKQEFIENTQANNMAKKEEKKDGPNITFIIILFVIILAAMFFLFPYLMNTLG